MIGRPRSNPKERFLSKISIIDSCWNWTGKLDKDGYGRFRLPDRWVLAHRFAYEYFKCSIGDLVIHHLCHNKKCVNPDHLEPMTIGDNNRQADHMIGVNLRKTHCVRGHEFSKSNTRIYKNSRCCRACDRARNQVRRKKIT